ncbi:ubiquitin carboxyl-terminal hydrolase family protein [Actinidia rufa]|uniref:Ubiquitin carboxyl-terminal hydrolase family protein n=1 Tax=Actinidia rufa TaxID=165716 RepID=A0A7J0ECT0_9ERIC|nr:ubiquitin carboxyl-terminal hydrolase family protein [Actinidia rufa]
MSQSVAIPKKLQMVRDHGYDDYMEVEKKMHKVLKFQDLILSQPTSNISVSRLDTLARRLGLSPKRTRKAQLQIDGVNEALIAQIPDAVTRLRKVMMLSNTGGLQLEHVRIARKDFGLPDDFEFSWQRVTYWSPYDDVSGYDLRSLEAQKRMEKRAVVMIHELLSLTVEKKIALERIAHFQLVMNLPRKLKDFVLQHQGIFYVSTRGNHGKLHTVFLREAYKKGELIEPNDLYLAKRKLVELILLSPKKAYVHRELVRYNGRLDGAGEDKLQSDLDCDSDSDPEYTDEDNGSEEGADVGAPVLGD